MRKKSVRERFLRWIKTNSLWDIRDVVEKAFVGVLIFPIPFALSYVVNQNIMMDIDESIEMEDGETLFSGYLPDWDMLPKKKAPY